MLEWKMEAISCTTVSQQSFKRSSSAHSILDISVYGSILPVSLVFFYGARKSSQASSVMCRRMFSRHVIFKILNLRIRIPGSALRVGALTNLTECLSLPCAWSISSFFPLLASLSELERIRNVHRNATRVLIRGISTTSVLFAKNFSSYYHHSESVFLPLLLVICRYN